MERSQKAQAWTTVDGDCTGGKCTSARAKRTNIYIYIYIFGTADEQAEGDAIKKSKDDCLAPNSEAKKEDIVEEKTPQCSNTNGKHVQWADLNGRAVLAYTPEDGLASPCPSSVVPSKPCLKV